MHRIHRVLFCVVSCVLFACSSQTDRAGAVSTQRVPAADSLVNPTIVAAKTAVPDSEIRHLTEELRIAPGAGDASKFTDIHEFVVDKQGSFWVFDDASKSIFVFDSLGKYVRKVGREGGGPGEFKIAGGMTALRDGRVAVWDDGNSRISFFSPAGELQSSWSVPSGAVRYRALSEGATGELYLKRTVYAESMNGGKRASRETLLRVRGTNLSDTLYVPDLHITEAEYEIGSEDGPGNISMSMVTGAEYAPKMLWQWHPDGYFVTGHGARYEITLYRTTDRPVQIQRSFTPVPVAADERKDEELSILGDPTKPWRGPPLPTVKPALMDLFVARDGRIWARVPMPTVVTIVDNPDKRPGKPAKVNSYGTPAVWEVFTPQGALAGRIAFPAGTRLMQADGNRVWAIQLDNEDVPAVVRFQVEPKLQ